jgi:tetratricopeptide (TPR) repeat protein
MLQVKEIRKQLERSFSMLTSDNQSTIQRHQTLRASMDWSWGLLSQVEQIFLRQLSVFVGGWTLESAQWVCEGDALDLIGTLIKKSLIIVDLEAERETRYRFHEIIRQYAREKLIEAGDEENIRRRHLKYFLQFSEQAESSLRGPAQIEWYIRLQHEQDNIRTALEQAARNHDVEAGLYLSGRLKRFWESSDLKEGIRWLAEFTDRSESKTFHHARAKALYAQVDLLIWMLQFERAYSAAEECLELYRKSRDPHGEVDGMLALAQALYQLDHPSQSIGLIQQALTLSESLNYRQKKADSLFLLGMSYRDLKRSHSYVDQAISLYRQIRGWSSLADCLSEWGHKTLLNGELQAAEEYLKEATLLSRQLNNKTWLASNLQIYGRIAFSLGDSEKARASIKESMEIGQATGNRMFYLWSRIHWGYLTLRQGEVIQAREIFTESTRDFFNEKIEQGVVFSLEGMAGLFIVVGKPEYAARLIGWADVTHEKIGDPRLPLEQADVDKIIAACLVKMGEVAFSDAYEEGQKMTLDEAVMYALGENHQ